MIPDMCILLGEVYSVAQTKLFVLPNKTKTRQMTFYSNAVDTPKQNMMILPVPSQGGPIKLHTIKYKSMFEDLKHSVASTERPRTSYGFTRSLVASASFQNETLEVILHGSYAVSIAPTLEDLLRLDLRVFPLTEDLLRFFGMHYNREFSYICCVLRPGHEGYEPLCYSHPMHSSGKLFVPTMHYHKHGDRVETEEADWDHLIYSVGTSEKANLGFTSNYENEVDWTKFPEEFKRLKVNSVRCSKIKGHHKNQDLGFEVY